MDESQLNGMDVQGSASDKPQDAGKLFTRDELAQIVATQRNAAARETEERLKKQQETNAIQAAQQQRNQQVPRDADTDAIYQQVQERFNQDMQKKAEQEHQKALQAEWERAANSYVSKVAAGKSQYSDFDEITKDFDPAAFPQLMYLIAGIDNAADIVYDLSQNSIKLAGLDRLAERNPKQAHNELLKLAQSAAANRQAQVDANSQATNPPLDRLQPSKISGSNGQSSVRDLRNQPWLRG
jgi:hypothetical protein